MCPENVEKNLAIWSHTNFVSLVVGYGFAFSSEVEKFQEKKPNLVRTENPSTTHKLNSEPKCIVQSPKQATPFRDRFVSPNQAESLSLSGTPKPAGFYATAEICVYRILL